MLTNDINSIVLSIDDVEHVLSMICITRDFIETAKGIKTDDQRNTFIEKAYRYVSLQSAAEEKLTTAIEYLVDAKEGIESFQKSAAGLFSGEKQVSA